MPTYQVDARDVARRIRESHEAVLARVVKAVRQEVLTAGPALAQTITRESTARRGAPISSGTYIRAWQARPLDAGAVLFNDAPHAIFVERGRRPGARMPPVSVIEEWLEQKMRGRIKSRRSRAEEARSLAFVVARAIARRGLPAHRIMAKTKRRLDPIVREAIRRELEREST